MTYWHSLLTFVHLESFEGLFQLSCCCKAWYSLFPIQTWTSRKSSASFSACFTCKPYLFHWAEILDLRWIQPSPIEPNFTAGPSKCWCFSGTSNHGLANKWRYMLCTRGYNRNVVFPPLFLIQVWHSTTLRTTISLLANILFLCSYTPWNQPCHRWAAMYQPALLGCQYPPSHSVIHK